MAQRPELSPGVPNYYPWATELVARPIRKKDGQVVVTDNKRPVLPEHTSYGLRYLEPPNFQELNWQMDGAYQWIRFFAEQYAIGDTFTTKRVNIGSETVAQLSARLGGTWESTGTIVVGGETIEFFTKVA